MKYVGHAGRDRLWGVMILKQVMHFDFHFGHNDPHSEWMASEAIMVFRIVLLTLELIKLHKELFREN